MGAERGSMGDDVLDVGGNVGEGAVGGEGNLDTGNHAAAQTPERTIPIERFNQVYGKVKEYEKQIGSWKEFGDPTSVKERLAKLEQWEKAVEEQRKTAAMTPTEQEEAKRTLQLQKELYKVMPSLKLLDKIEDLEGKIADYENRFSETQASAVLKDHSAKFSTVLKSNKIDAKFQPKIEEFIVSQMSDDDKQRFIKGDFTVAEEIFNRELQDGLFATMKAKPSVPTPPMRNTPGGTPPNGASKKPMTMKEAEDAAWARMNGNE